MCSWETGSVILQLFDTSVPEMLKKWIVNALYMIEIYIAAIYNFNASFTYLSCSVRGCKIVDKLVIIDICETSVGQVILVVGSL